PNPALSVRSSRAVSVAVLPDAEKSTFPLWMYVRTSPNPSASRQARRSAIRITFLPPTLIPRRSATYRATSEAYGAPLIPGPGPLIPTLGPSKQMGRVSRTDGGRTVVSVRENGGGTAGADRRPLGTVVASAVDGFRTLARAHVDLAKIEVGEAASVRAKGVGMFGAAAVAVMYAVGFVAAAGAAALALVLPVWAAIL